MNEKGKARYGEVTYPSWDTERVELLQARWDSLREFLEMIPDCYMDKRSFNEGVIKQEGMEQLRKLVLFKMNELESGDKE